METSFSQSQMEQSKSLGETASENIHLYPGASGTRRRTRILQGNSDEWYTPSHLEEDSTRDDEEAKNDFWTITGEFIHRHHVVPRVKLYVPQEETFPIPTKYIDVTRTTHTSFDVLMEKHMEDFWNVDGARKLSDAWTGFTRFILMNERPPDGFSWSGKRLTRNKQPLVLMMYGQICGRICPMQS